MSRNTPRRTVIHQEKATKLLESAISNNNRKVAEFSKNTLPMYMKMFINAKNKNKKENEKINKRIISILASTKHLPSNFQMQLIANLVKSNNLIRGTVLKKPTRASTASIQRPQTTMPTRKLKRWVWAWEIPKMKKVHPI